MRIKDIEVHDAENPDQKTRIYVWPEGETIIQNLEHRRTRPYTEYRKFMPDIFHKTSIPANSKASWRQTAGCACGCSPGFIIDNDFGRDIHVTIVA